MIEYLNSMPYPYDDESHRAWFEEFIPCAKPLLKGIVSCSYDVYRAGCETMIINLKGSECDSDIVVIVQAMGRSDYQKFQVCDFDKGIYVDVRDLIEGHYFVAQCINVFNIGNEHVSLIVDDIRM